MRTMNIVMGLVVALMVTLAGCATIDKAQIKGKDIYIGMSQQSLEAALGAPDRVVRHMNANGKGSWYSQYYGKYRINVSDGLVSYINQK